MRKTYRYRDLVYPVADDTDLNFTVEFISDGNSGITTIFVPGNPKPEIEDAGTVFIGKGSQLRGEIIVCVSDLANPVPEEDEIRVKYKINDTLIVEHHNLKSEEERPIVILFLKFPKP